MNELQDSKIWYEDVPYQECKEIINTRLQSMTRDFIAIGYYLKYVRDHELYLEDGPDQEWPELLSDMPLFNPIVIQDYLQGEEHGLKEHLECEGLPEMLVLKKQMQVSGLRLLLELVSRGHKYE